MLRRGPNIKMHRLIGENACELKAAAVRWLLGLVSACVLSNGALAQQLDKNLDLQPFGKPAFKQSGTSTPFGKTAPIDRAQPLYLQGDELIYDNTGRRVTARGNVEIYYNNYILTADEVVYDQGAGQLTAHGNVLLREPNGAKTTAERLVLSDDFRDGFVQSLSFVAKDDSKITASRATRREGNVTEFENGKFTPCKSPPGTPPVWCITSPLHPFLHRIFSMTL